jgi:opacity protein-like surface antigen
MKATIFVFFLLFGLCVSNQLQAQDSTNQADKSQERSSQMYRVELNDGSVFFGQILEQDEQRIILKTKSIQRIELLRSDIKQLEAISSSAFRDGSYWFPNPNSTRYLFGSSAFNLKKGEWSYQNTYLFFNAVNVGITDFLSVGVGLELVSTIGSISSGSFEPVFFFTPKVGVPVTDNFSAGGGLLLFSFPDFDGGREQLSIAYGTGTFGNVDKNLTVGMGWGYFDGEFSPSPVVTIAGLSRFSRKLAFVSENWFVPSEGYYGIYSYGLRFIREKLAVDLAFLNNADIASGFFIGVPYASFTVKF